MRAPADMEIGIDELGRRRPVGIRAKQDIDVIGRPLRMVECEAVDRGEAREAAQNRAGNARPLPRGASVEPVREFGCGFILQFGNERVARKRDEIA